MGDNNQVEWEKGDREGPGGPLPTKKGKSLVIFSEVGKGTLDDPCIIWLLNPGFDRNTLRGYESFAVSLCKEFGFSFLWLRSEVHDGRTKRCSITGRKTGYEPNSDQDHITVYLGLLRNWVLVHGHFYTIKNEKSSVPVGLLPATERWPDKNGKKGRNPELWVWTKQRAQEESVSSRQARTSNWRAGPKEKQESKDRSWGNSRLPKR